MVEYFPLTRLQEILVGMRRLRAGVVGDFSLHGVWTVDMSRSSQAVGTAHFSRPVVNEEYACGGGAQVALYLAALGVAHVRALTVLGSDWRGDLLRQELRGAGVDDQDALADPGWSTPFTGRLALAADPSRQADAPLHFINTGALSLDSEETLLSRVEASLSELDALIITDYQSQGVITPAVREGLNRLASATDRLVITVDSRVNIGAFNDMIRTPDAAEAARWLFPERPAGLVSLADFVEAALYPQVDCGCPLFINLGADGCLVLEGGESHHVMAPKQLAATEERGAFLAALTAALAAGARPEEAAPVGLLAAEVSTHAMVMPGADLPGKILSANQS